MGMNEHWYKLDPNKGLPFGKTVIVLRKDGTMVAGARSVNGKNSWDAYIGHTIYWDNENSEILYWTDQLGTPPKKVTRVFISQPMSGRTVQEIRDERANALAELSRSAKFKDVILVEINSFNENALNNSNPITELGKCISLMTNADFVIFCKGWDKSRGCRVEFEVAKQYGIPHDWIDEYPIP